MSFGKACIACRSDILPSSILVKIQVFAFEIELYQQDLGIWIALCGGLLQKIVSFLLVHLDSMAENICHAECEHACAVAFGSEFLHLRE